MSSPGITYAPCPGATPEAELSALSAAYKFILDSAKKNAADVTSTDGDDAKGSRNDRAKRSIPRQSA